MLIAAELTLLSCLVLGGCEPLVVPEQTPEQRIYNLYLLDSLLNYGNQNRILPMTPLMRTQVTECRTAGDKLTCVTY